eukprot:14004799-Ditylum_brightwellii.AAC.1
MQLQLGADICTPLREGVDVKNNTSKNKLCHAQSQATELRDKMLEEMARDCATHGNSDTTTIIKNIWHREEVKTLFRIMQPIAKSKTGGTVSYIKETTSLKSPSTYPKTLINLGLQAECREIHD